MQFGVCYKPWFPISQRSRCVGRKQNSHFHSNNKRLSYLITLHYHVLRRHNHGGCSAYFALGNGLQELAELKGQHVGQIERAARPSLRRWSRSVSKTHHTVFYSITTFTGQAHDNEQVEEHPTEAASPKRPNVSRHPSFHLDPEIEKEDRSLMHPRPRHITARSASLAPRPPARIPPAQSAGQQAESEAFREALAMLEVSGSDFSSLDQDSRENASQGATGRTSHKERRTSDEERRTNGRVGECHRDCILYVQYPSPSHHASPLSHGLPALFPLFLLSMLRCFSSCACLYIYS